MPRRPKIKITCIDRLGKCPCHRGQICPMVMHVAFPYIDILRYGGEIPQPGQEKGSAIFCCPDVETINVFKIERIDHKEG